MARERNPPKITPVILMGLTEGVTVRREVEAVRLVDGVRWGGATGLFAGDGECDCRLRRCCGSKSSSCSCLRGLYALRFDSVSWRNRISDHIGISLGPGAIGSGMVFGGGGVGVVGAVGPLGSPMAAKHCSNSISAARLCCSFVFGPSVPSGAVSLGGVGGSRTNSRLATSIGAGACGRR